ncbi:MAG TPA: MBL fold metallo-hydrolase [Gemmatimonadaceae bacterium]|nr:MBL fold metallo-hydrolase [Gemmatimonadaceae bacterium]
MGYSVCVFLVRGQLIDTGFPGASETIARLLDERSPTGIVVTHQHEDHAGNVELAARRGVPIAMARVTEDALRAGEANVGLYRRACWGTMAPLRAAIEPHEPVGLELIATPGHSPDHHVVWDAERETLFAGDLFLGVKVRVARPMEDPRALAASARRAAALRPQRLFDAHRGLVPNGAEMLRAKAAWLEETIGAVDAHIARGWSDRAITRAVLGREDVVALVSRGDLSRLNFVRAVRATAGPWGG